MDPHRSATESQIAGWATQVDELERLCSRLPKLCFQRVTAGIELAADLADLRPLQEQLLAKPLAWHPAAIAAWSSSMNSSKYPMPNFRVLQGDEGRELVRRRSAFLTECEHLIRGLPMKFVEIHSAWEELTNTSSPIVTCVQLHLLSKRMKRQLDKATSAWVSVCAQVQSLGLSILGGLPTMNDALLKKLESSENSISGLFTKMVQASSPEEIQDVVRQQIAFKLDHLAVQQTIRAICANEPTVIKLRRRVETCMAMLAPERKVEQDAMPAGAGTYPVELTSYVWDKQAQRLTLHIPLPANWKGDRDYRAYWNGAQQTIYIRCFAAPSTLDPRTLVFDLSGIEMHSKVKLRVWHVPVKEKPEHSTVHSAGREVHDPNWWPEEAL